MLLKRREGNATIIVSVLLIAIMGIIALVIDMGVVFAEKAKLTNAIDAAILAGGQELPDGQVEARAVMEAYLIENGVSLDQVTITIDADGLGAEIIANKDVDHYFAKILGFNSTVINEETRLKLGTASSVKGGIRPFGVEQFAFEYGDLVTLKEGAGDGTTGNYGAIALGGTGVPVLLNNALYGYDKELKVGDVVDTEPGNMASIINPIATYINAIGETFDDFASDSERSWTIPVFESLEVNGRDAVEVIGFAQFFVDSVTKVKGKAQIHGRFIKYVANGDIDETIDNTGVYGMKLVE